VKVLLDIGVKAPDFKLSDQKGNLVCLSDYAGKWLVLAFYPEDSSPVCTKQLCSYSNAMEEFSGFGAEVVGISTNTVQSHKKFAERRKIEFPLLSDTDFSVSKAYCALYPVVNKSKRVVYIIDPEGIIKYKSLEFTPLTYKSSDKLLKELKKL